MEYMNSIEFRTVPIFNCYWEEKSTDMLHNVEHYLYEKENSMILHSEMEYLTYLAFARTTIDMMCKRHPILVFENAYIDAH